MCVCMYSFCVLLCCEYQISIVVNKAHRHFANETNVCFKAQINKCSERKTHNFINSLSLVTRSIMLNSKVDDRCISLALCPSGEEKNNCQHQKAKIDLSKEERQRRREAPIF